MKKRFLFILLLVGSCTLTRSYQPQLSSNLKKFYYRSIAGLSKIETFENYTIEEKNYIINQYFEDLFKGDSENYTYQEFKENIKSDPKPADVTLGTSKYPSPIKTMYNMMKDKVYSWFTTPEEPKSSEDKIKHFQKIFNNLFELFVLAKLDFLQHYNVPDDESFEEVAPFEIHYIGNLQKLHKLYHFLALSTDDLHEYSWDKLNALSLILPRDHFHAIEDKIGVVGAQISPPVDVSNTLLRGMSVNGKQPLREYYGNEMISRYSKHFMGIRSHDILKNSENFSYFQKKLSLENTKQYFRKDLVEAGIGAEEKFFIEYQNLSKPVNLEEFAQVTQLLAVREVMINSWAVQRFQEDRNFSSYAYDCAKGALSFRGPTDRNLDQAYYNKELWLSDFHYKVLPKIVEDAIQIVTTTPLLGKDNQYETMINELVSPQGKNAQLRDYMATWLEADVESMNAEERNQFSRELFDLASVKDTEARVVATAFLKSSLDPERMKETEDHYVISEIPRLSELFQLYDSQSPEYIASIMAITSAHYRIQGIMHTLAEPIFSSGMIFDSEKDLFRQEIYNLISPYRRIYIRDVTAKIIEKTRKYFSKEYQAQEFRKQKIEHIKSYLRDQEYLRAMYVNKKFSEGKSTHFYDDKNYISAKNQLSFDDPNALAFVLHRLSNAPQFSGIGYSILYNQKIGDVLRDYIKDVREKYVEKIEAIAKKKKKNITNEDRAQAMWRAIRSVSVEYFKRYPYSEDKLKDFHRRNIELMPFVGTREYYNSQVSQIVKDINPLDVDEYNQLKETTEQQMTMQSLMNPDLKKYSEINEQDKINAQLFPHNDVDNILTSYVNDLDSQMRLGVKPQEGERLVTFNPKASYMRNTPNQVLYEFFKMMGQNEESLRSEQFEIPLSYFSRQNLMQQYLAEYKYYKLKGEEPLLNAHVQVTTPIKRFVSAGSGGGFTYDSSKTESVPFIEYVEKDYYEPETGKSNFSTLDKDFDKLLSDSSLFLENGEALEKFCEFDYTNIHDSNVDKYFFARTIHLRDMIIEHNRKIKNEANLSKINKKLMKKADKSLWLARKLEDVGMYLIYAIIIGAAIYGLGIGLGALGLFQGFVTKQAVSFMGKVIIKTAITLIPGLKTIVGSSILQGGGTLFSIFMSLFFNGAFYMLSVFLILHSTILVPPRIEFRQSITTASYLREIGMTKEILTFDDYKSVEELISEKNADLWMTVAMFWMDIYGLKEIEVMMANTAKITQARFAKNFLKYNDIQLGIKPNKYYIPREEYFKARRKTFVNNIKYYKQYIDSQLKRLPMWQDISDDLIENSDVLAVRLAIKEGKSAIHTLSDLTHLTDESKRFLNLLLQVNTKLDYKIIGKLRSNKTKFKAVKEQLLNFAEALTRGENPEALFKQSEAVLNKLDRDAARIFRELVESSDSITSLEKSGSIFNPLKQKYQLYATDFLAKYLNKPDQLKDLGTNIKRIIKRADEFYGTPQATQWFEVSKNITIGSRQHTIAKGTSHFSDIQTLLDIKAKNERIIKKLLDPNEMGKLQNNFDLVYDNWVRLMKASNPKSKVNYLDEVMKAMSNEGLPDQLHKFVYEYLFKDQSTLSEVSMKVDEAIKLKQGFKKLVDTSAKSVK
ncbi:MAG: hypothetical protein H6621_12110 [Halobacteriovoraceae bacterium]|nr:hypothetical protein [Halobacteriovoraceae bacterium]MCB9095804.1 hypothetical protein [Halobacteriovoraceae bacterium]